MPTDWLVVDTPNAVWRAFYSAGMREPLPSVLLAVHQVERLAREFDVEHVAWAFDRKPYRRSELFREYKARRERVKLDEADQAAIEDTRGRIRKLADDYLPKLGYQNVLARKGYEADDVIARAVQCLPAGHRAILVSADEDLYQLLSARCAVYHPVTDTFVTAKSFRAEHRIEPPNWAAVKAIAGCSSDDVPGVRGVGEKTAVKWLRNALPRIHKVAYDIHEFVKTEDYRRNLVLTTLPFDGIPEIELVPDPPRTPTAWRDLCESLDMGRLAEAVEGDGVDSLFRQTSGGL